VHYKNNTLTARLAHAQGTLRFATLYNSQTTQKKLN
jgi:hypothetical protein